MPSKEKVCGCAVLPCNMLTSIASKSLMDQRAMITEMKGNVLTTNHVARSVTVQKFDELGSIEARAADKVLMQPAPLGEE